MIVKHFDHVTVCVSDLEAAKRFFGLLGLKEDYRRPEAARDPNIARLDRLGFNHICFAVEDIEAMVENLRSKGVEVRGELKEFHDRQLFFLTGPDGITVELAQWS